MEGRTTVNYLYHSSQLTHINKLDGRLLNRAHFNKQRQVKLKLSTTGIQTQCVNYMLLVGGRGQTPPFQPLNENLYLQDSFEFSREILTVLKGFSDCYAL